MKLNLLKFHPVFAAIETARQLGDIKIWSHADAGGSADINSLLHGFVFNCMDLPSDRLREYWPREKEARAMFDDWSLLNEPQRFVRVAEWVIACYVRKFAASRLGLKPSQVEVIVKVVGSLGNGEHFTNVDRVFDRYPKIDTVKPVEKTEYSQK